MTYEAIIEKAIKIPYVHKILISDMNGNMLASDGTSSDEEAALSALLYQSALQAGTALEFANFQMISFLFRQYRGVIVTHEEFIILCIVDQKVAVTKLMNDIRQ